MRSLLFFDLPMESNIEKKAYRDFTKLIKTQVFFMVQKSVYCKLSIDNQSATSTIKQINKALPRKGVIFVLTVTEKQYASMIYLLGSSETDVLENDQRIVEL